MQEHTEIIQTDTCTRIRATGGESHAPASYGSHHSERRAIGVSRLLLRLGNSRGMNEAEEDIRRFASAVST